MKRKQSRQGDILFTPIKQIPDEATAAKNERIIAKGEITGHHHALANVRKAMLFLMMTNAGQKMFMRVKEKTEIVHDTHNPITVYPGDYEIKRQEEYDPFTKIRRQVQD